MRPITCNYYVTLRCNSRCEFCNIWKRKIKSSEPTIAQIENNLNHLKKLGVKLIDFTGGEPLLYSYLPEALKLAKSMGFFTSITTNCILYPKRAKELTGKVDILQFSLEAPDAKRHDEIRGVNCFSKVMDSIKIAKNQNQRFQLIFTVTDKSIAWLSEMCKFAQENKILLALNPCFSYFKNKPISKEYIEALKRTWLKKYVIGDLAMFKLVENGGNDINNPICRPISSTIVISPDNYLMLPCFHHCTKQIKIEDNIVDIYNSKRISNLKKTEGKASFCQGCTIYCYMRNTLFLKYPFRSILSGLKFIIESIRVR